MSLTPTFREMRRSRQSLAPEQCSAILREATHGVLAVVGDGGYPYGVPLSHAYSAGHLYFHCALTGHKVDAIRGEAKASYTVVAQDRVVEERFTTAYRSVIAFGRVRIVDDATEREAILRRIAGALCPSQSAAAVEAEIASAFSRTLVLDMAIEHLAGKQGRELMKGQG